MKKLCFPRTSQPLEFCKITSPNARKGVSRIVVFKIFLREHAPRSPTMGQTYKSKEAPGTRPSIFHEVSATEWKVALSATSLF